MKKGFKKLSLRQVRLRLGDSKSKNSNFIYCAGGCDYTPSLEGYGYCFIPVAKVKFKNEYLTSKEYQSRNAALSNSYKRFKDATKNKL